MSRNGYLRTARIFADRSNLEFRKARAAMDDAGIRQAAEKGWGAAFQATEALMAKKGKKPLRGTTRLKEALLELDRRDRNVAHADLYHFFLEFLNELHVNCFGEGDYSIKVVERAINKLPDFIKTIEAL